MRVMSALAKIGCLGIVGLIGGGLILAKFVAPPAAEQGQQQAAAPAQPGPTKAEFARLDRAGETAKKFLYEFHGGEKVSNFVVLNAVHDADNRRYVVKCSGGIVRDKRGTFTATVADDDFRLLTMQTDSWPQVQLYPAK